MKRRLAIALVAGLLLAAGPTLAQGGPTPPPLPAPQPAGNLAPGKGVPADAKKGDDEKSAPEKRETPPTTPTTTATAASHLPASDPYGAIIHGFLGDLDPAFIAGPLLLFTLYRLVSNTPDVIAVQFPKSAEAWRELRHNVRRNTEEYDEFRGSEKTLRELVNALDRAVAPDPQTQSRWQRLRRRLTAWLEVQTRDPDLAKEFIASQRQYRDRHAQADVLMEEGQGLLAATPDGAADRLALEAARHDWNERADFTGLKQWLDARRSAWKGTMDALASELLDLPGIRNGKSVERDAEAAIRAWRDEGNPEPLAAFLRSHAGRVRGTPAGTQWATRLGAILPLLDWAARVDRWQTLESAARTHLVGRANRLMTAVNDLLAPNERMPIFREPSPSDIAGRFTYANGNEIVFPQLHRDVRSFCRTALGVFQGKANALTGRAGVGGVNGQLYQLLRPYGNTLLTGTAAGLTVVGFVQSYRNHGKSPEAVKADITKQAAVENAQAVNAEASLEGQIAKHREKLAPFTDAVVAELKSHRADIEKRVMEYRAKNPGTTIDWEKKRAQFEKNLAFHVLSNLAYTARARIGQDVTFPQLLKFLALPSADPKVTDPQRLFLTTLYSRALDGLFPELQSVRAEGPSRENLVTVTAGMILGEGKDNVRAQLVTHTLPRMATGLRIEVPPNVPAHPGVPDLNPGPQAMAPPRASPTELARSSP